MGSLVEELKRREGAARAEADRLRSRIEELSQDLARAEEEVSQLVIAREEVARVLEDLAAAEPPAGPASQPSGEPRPASPIGAVTVPPWQEVLPPSLIREWITSRQGAFADGGLCRRLPGRLGQAASSTVTCLPRASRRAMSRCASRSGSVRRSK